MHPWSSWFPKRLFPCASPSVMRLASESEHWRFLFQFPSPKTPSPPPGRQESKDAFCVTLLGPLSLRALALLRAGPQATTLHPLPLGIATFDSPLPFAATSLAT